MANQRLKKPLPSQASPIAQARAKGQQGAKMSAANKPVVPVKPPVKKGGVRGY